MVKPAKGDWVAISFALLGLLLLALQTATALIWIALWLGTTVMLVASRQRGPRFVPLPAPAPAIQNLDSARIEGSPAPWGWYWMIFPLTATLAVAPAALLSPTQGILAYGAVCTLNLLVWLGFAVAHDRDSARIADRLLHDWQHRVFGVVSEVQGPIIRQISWHVWSGTHHGTTQIEGIHGEIQNVATVTHTTNCMGYREEQLHGFIMTVDDAPEGQERVRVDPKHLLWAATIEPSDGEGGADSLRKRGVVEEHTLRMFQRVGGQREQIRAGDRVIVRAPPAAWAVGMTEIVEEFRGSADDPILVYAGPHEVDPRLALGAVQRVRRLSIASIAACLIVCVVAMFVGSS